MLAAVRAEVIQRARSEGGAALKTLPRYALCTRIHQVSTHKILLVHAFSLFNLTKYLTSSLVFVVLFSSQISTEVFLHLRYKGTDCALMVTAAGYPSNAQSCLAGDFRSAFTKRLAHLLNDFLVYSCTELLAGTHIHSLQLNMYPPLFTLYKQIHHEVNVSFFHRR